jgi:hypothetical protein
MTMVERVRTNRPRTTEGPSGIDDPFGSIPGAESMVRVNGEQLPVAGMTIADIRRRLADRLDIQPNYPVRLDGADVDDEQTALLAGQTLEFIRRAGEKGVLRASRRQRASPGPTAEIVTLRDNVATVVTDEGNEYQMPIEQLFRLAVPTVVESGGLNLSSEVRFGYTRGQTTVLVCEYSAGPYTLFWVTDDSELAGGVRPPYRAVTISLPYVIVMAAFEDSTLSNLNECFFSTTPLGVTDEDNELLFPGLLNCSRFEPQEGRPLSWICTEELNRRAIFGEPEPRRRLHLGLKALRECLFQSGFNYSSDNHEYASWYTESRRVDRRVSNIDRWQTATKKNGFFALDVPWIKTGKNVRQIVERMFDIRGVSKTRIRDVRQIARIIINHHES